MRRKKVIILFAKGRKHNLVVALVGGSSLLRGFISIQNFTGTNACQNFEKVTAAFDLLCEFQLLGKRAIFLSTSESLGITVTPGTFLKQSVNMGDRELLCENL